MQAMGSFVYVLIGDKVWYLIITDKIHVETAKAKQNKIPE